MQEVSIIGIGMTHVGEHWGQSLREIGHKAVKAALADAGVGLGEVGALVVGNSLANQLNKQSHVAALLADYVGLRGAEAVRVESADASGGMALRQGMLLVASGAAQYVVVLGVEKVTDVVGSGRVDILATQLDADYEAAQGATPTAMAGILMRRYMHEYGLELAQFENFSIQAHANGTKNPHAMYRNSIKAGKFASAPIVAPPVNLFDSAPEGDGACALVLTTSELAQDRVPQPVRIRASAAAVDTLALHDRPDPLWLSAANIAAGRAYQQAGIQPHDLDVLELHDSYTVLSALQLEAIGFAERGQGWGAWNKVPMSTFGGLKARGNPIGATGIYQAAEVALQLRDQAGATQVADAHWGMALNLGGLGASAVAHILERSL